MDKVFRVLKLYILQGKSMKSIVDSEYDVRSSSEISSILDSYGFKRGDKRNNLQGGQYKGYYDDYLKYHMTMKEAEQWLREYIRKYRSGMDFGDFINKSIQPKQKPVTPRPAAAPQPAYAPPQKSNQQVISELLAIPYHQLTAQQRSFLNAQGYVYDDSYTMNKWLSPQEAAQKRKEDIEWNAKKAHDAQLKSTGHVKIGNQWLTPQQADDERSKAIAEAKRRLAEFLIAEGQKGYNEFEIVFIDYRNHISQLETSHVQVEEVVKKRKFLPDKIEFVRKVYPSFNLRHDVLYSGDIDSVNETYLIPRGLSVSRVEVLKKWEGGYNAEGGAFSFETVKYTCTLLKLICAETQSLGQNTYQNITNQSVRYDPHQTLTPLPPDTATSAPLFLKHANLAMEKGRFAEYVMQKVNAGEFSFSVVYFGATTPNPNGEKVQFQAVNQGKKMLFTFPSFNLGFPDIENVNGMYLIPRGYRIDRQTTHDEVPNYPGAIILTLTCEDLRRSV